MRIPFTGAQLVKANFIILFLILLIVLIDRIFSIRTVRMRRKLYSLQIKLLEKELEEGGDN